MVGVKQFHGLTYALCKEGTRGLGGQVVWGADLPTSDRAGWQARFPLLPGHVALPTTGALVNAWYNLSGAVNR